MVDSESNVQCHLFDYLLTQQKFYDELFEKNRMTFAEIRHYEAQGAQPKRHGQSGDGPQR